MVVDSIEREIVIEAPVDVVWSIVTEPEHVARWFSDEAQIDLQAGGDALVTWHHEAGPFRVRIETVDPRDTSAYAGSAAWCRARRGQFHARRVQPAGPRVSRSACASSRAASSASIGPRTRRPGTEGYKVRGWAMELDELRADASRLLVRQDDEPGRGETTCLWRRPWDPTGWRIIDILWLG